MTGRLRIAVAGGGPAGLAAALMLHRAGHEVTIFERFERPQPLGSGLMIQPTGLAVLDDQIEDEGQLAFARYTHRTVRRPYGEALAHIGDAWHSTSPQLGQGANMALLDAWALARALETAPDVPAALRLYRRLRVGHVGVYQAMSFLFTPVYQSDSHLLPLLRDRLVGPLARLWPAPLVLAAMVGGLIGAPLGRLGLRRRG